MLVDLGNSNRVSYTRKYYRKPSDEATLVQTLEHSRYDVHVPLHGIILADECDIDRSER